MPLPKIQHALTEIVQESTKKKVKFRPYLVKEEKILMAAKQSGNLDEIFLSMQQILTNCCTDPTIDMDKIPIFDFEMFFLKLRSISVNNKENITITDKNDKKDIHVQIDFDKIKVKWPEEPADKIIKLPGGIVVSLKYPSAKIYQNKDLLTKILQNDIFDFVVDCVDTIYQGETLIPFEREELVEFLGDMDHKTFLKLREWISKIPHVDYSIKYKNSLGEDREEKFTKLMDFFFCL